MMIGAFRRTVRITNRPPTPQHQLSTEIRVQYQGEEIVNVCISVYH